MANIDMFHKLNMGTVPSGVLDRGMYYPSSVRYPELGLTEMKSDEDDVLDLCVRKQDREDANDKFAGDVNGNGFAENSNSFYKSGFRCKSPETLLQQTNVRYVQPVLGPSDPDSSPTPVTHQEKIYQDEAVQSSPNSLSPSNSQSFVADSLGSRFLPLPTTISAITARNGKPTRPFKAYPKDFLTLATSEGLLDDSSKRYMEFRRQFLTQLHATTGLTSNKNMKRPVQSDSPNQLPSSSGDAKDQAYWERRKKNNEAAKKSRDARRAKEDEIAIRAAFLERENVRLKLELASLRSETDRLRCMLYTS